METGNCVSADIDMTSTSQKPQSGVRQSSPPSKDSACTETKMVNDKRSVAPLRKRTFRQREEETHVAPKRMKKYRRLKREDTTRNPEERIPPLHSFSKGPTNGLLSSVLKADLGEILRRSCRERKFNSRYGGEASWSNDALCVDTSQLKAKGSGHVTSRVGASEGHLQKKRNGMFPNQKCAQREAVKTVNDHDSPKDPGIPEPDQKLVVRRTDAARKSFARNALNGIYKDNELPISDLASSLETTVDDWASDSSKFSEAAPVTGTYLQVKARMLTRAKRKGRHFKGSTYYLSIHPNRRKRKALLVENAVSSAVLKRRVRTFKKRERKLNARITSEETCTKTAESNASGRPNSAGHLSTKSGRKLNSQPRKRLLPKLPQRPSVNENSISQVFPAALGLGVVSGERSSFEDCSGRAVQDVDRIYQKTLGSTRTCHSSKEPLTKINGCNASSCAPCDAVDGIQPEPGKLSKTQTEDILKTRRSLGSVRGGLDSFSPSAADVRDQHAVDTVFPLAKPLPLLTSRGRTLKVSSRKGTAWHSPMIIPLAWSEDRRRVTSVTVQQVEFVMEEHLLCTCASQEGIYDSRDVVASYCQGIDYIDCRLIGCVNSVSTNVLLRPSVRVPFQALCEVHRQRLKMHQCCPSCGLFCTQGSFLQCHSDPQKFCHHVHKECVLFHGDKAICPHCGEECHLSEVDVELNTPRTIAFFLKQHQREKREPGARMAFTRGNENIFGEDASDCLPRKSYKLPDSGKEISSAGLPIGTSRHQLESVLGNLSNEHDLSRRPANQRYSLKIVHSAIKNGDVEKVMQVLMMGFDPNTRFDEFGRATALHIAAYHGHLCLVHILIQGGACLDSLDSMLQTPIMLSIENGHHLVSQYLIKAGAQLDSRGEDGMTALHLAAKAGQLDICRMILDTGKVNTNVVDDGGWIPLVWAAEHRHLGVVRFLLERGSDPNLRDNEHNIALHWSAYSGSFDICEIFLNHGCDINCVNEHGDTPLHIAARQDKYEVVMLLLARNADVDVCNKEHETPIMCCHDQTAQTWLALSMTTHLKMMSGNRTARTEVIVHRDISRGKELNPIQCVNSIDEEGPPSDFIYVKENCETLPIGMDRSISSLQSCVCEDDCSTPSCTCGTMSLKCWYTKEGRLIDAFNLLDPPMIFECNRSCQCWTSCNNRVLQHGITCRLQLFRTKGKGWGVRTLREIPRGTFICEYVGELISDLEADKREDDSYLFDLDNRDGETFCIDARRYGNISRFINHLCEPNVVPVKIFVDYQDLRFPRIALFSSRTIAANEELGFDYGDKFWIIKSKAFTCLCGVEKCKYSEATIQETLANYHRRLQELD